MGSKRLRWADVLASAPETWKRVPLGEAFEERKEQDHPDLPLLSVTAEDGVVPRDSLARRDTSNPDKSNYLRVCAGDIVYNTMRMWQGVSALVPEEGIVSPAYTVCTPRQSIDATFASYLLKFPTLVNVFRNRSQGLVDDTLSLRFDEFAKIRTALPSISEQMGIVEILGSVDEAIQATQAVIEQTRKVKQGLLQELLTRGIGHTRFKRTEIGMLPAPWELSTLGEVAQLRSGTTPSRRVPEFYNSGEGYPWVKTMDLTNWLVHDTDENITTKALEQTALHLHPPGTVLIAMYGGFQQIGRTGVLAIYAATNQAICALDLSNSLVLPEFCNEWLIGKRQLWRKFAASSRKDPNITKNDVARFPIAIPSIVEQEKIVSIVQAPMQVAYTLEAELQILNLLKAGLMQVLLSGRIRVQDTTVASKMPMSRVRN